ncbi:peptidoglycan-binding domain-containing protein [Streptomyces hydrogenans]|uniref:peptidoglycan-binding domain-containing protein n=1 Tax=Streptomyces hydrogenans TaxID=1873719 RepID=UPI003D73D4D9
MRHRTALTTAVTPVTPEPPSAPPLPGQPHPVFGQVAAGGPDGRSGVRAQDLELFDSTRPLPVVPTAPRRRGGRHAPAPRRRRAAPLPPLLMGLLAAGVGAALPVYLTARPDSPAPHPSTLTMPDLPPPPTLVPDPVDTTGVPSRTPSTRPTPPPAPTPTPTPTRTAPKATRSAPAPVTVTAVAPPPTTRAATPPPPAPPASPPPTHERHRPSSGPDGPRVGSSGPEVLEVQVMLQRLGLYEGPLDGEFGESTELAVIHFQWSVRVFERPGVCGPLTLAALREASA